MEKIINATERFNSINKVIGKIYTLQAKLNKDFNGEDWLSTGISKKTNKPVNMGCALLDEAVELMGSFPWKHWDGKTETNYPNMVTEAVDILHFIPSIIEEIASDKKGWGLEPSSIYELSYSTLVQQDITVYDHDITIEGHAIIVSSLAANVAVAYNLGKYTQDGFSFRLLGDRIRDCLHYLFIFLENHFNLTPEDIFKKYLIKNTLNRFRKNNGYADGTYNKIWDGTEDNDYIFNLVKDMDVEDQDAMYEVMDKAYKSIFSL